MNTTQITDSFTVQSVPFAVSARLAVWLQRIGAAWAAPAQARIDLRQIDAGATTWVARPRGCVVRCQAGTLWLAFDGEPQDVILEAGESFRCTSASRLSIHAMTAAAVSVA
jgi:hypothetical protein